MGPFGASFKVKDSIRRVYTVNRYALGMGSGVQGPGHEGLGFWGDAFEEGSGFGQMVSDLDFSPSSAGAVATSSRAVLKAGQNARFDEMAAQAS